METFAFVDTNLLLHYQLFTEVDWHKELGVADVTLFSRRLSSLKWMTTNGPGHNARRRVQSP
jgi:hypothetical protein